MDPILFDTPIPSSRSRLRQYTNFIKSLPNLWAYWPMNELSGTTMNNQAPGANQSISNGLLVGGTLPGQTGTLGKAYRFDGVNDIVELVSNTFNFKNSTAISIGLIINNTNVASERVIYHEDRTGNTTIPRVYLSLTNAQKLRFIIRTAFSDSTEADITSTPVVPAGYSLLVVTVDVPTDTFKMYINGVSVAFTGGTTLTNASLVASNPDDVPLLGAIYTGGGHANRGSFFGGLMQHLFFVKRVLTQDEVSKLSLLSSA